MAVKTMAELPAQMSNEYSGALWEIGDFLFAAKSIAKIANGKGSWGDAFNVGISAASLFFPPLKLGKLATPALKAIAVESEKMLATDVVSSVARKQLEKNISHVGTLLNHSEETRPMIAQQLEDGTYQITDLVDRTASSSNTRPWDVYGKYSTDPVKRAEDEAIHVSGPGTTTLSTAEKEATKTRELELANQRSEEDLLYSIEDPYGYQKMRERRAFSKEAEQRRKTPNQTDPEKNTMPRDAVDDTEYAINLIDSHESKVQRLSVLHSAVSDHRASDAEVNEYFKLIAGLRRSGRKYVEAKKSMEDPTSRASVLAEITFTNNLTKLSVADIKTAKAKYTSDAFGVRKFFDRIDEGLTELSRPVQKDIVTTAEAEQVNIAGLANEKGEFDLTNNSRMMADSTSDSGGYIEDIIPAKNRSSDSIDFESGIDSSAKFDVGAEGGKYGIGKKPNVSRTTLAERRKDIKFAKRRIAQLESEVASGVKLNEAKRYVPADELKKAKLELSRLTKELKEAAPRNPNAAVPDNQRAHLDAFKKHLNPTVDIPGRGGTAPKTVSLLDRIDRLEGFLTKQGSLNLRKKMLEGGSTEKQFFAQVEKYKKELEGLKVRVKHHDSTFRETLGKLDERSMSKVSSWIESLDETALRRTALKHKTFYAQKSYLNKLAMATTDTAARKRILSVIDKLDTEARMGLRKTLAKRTSLQQEQLAKATGQTGSSTARAIERNVSLRESQKIMTSKDVIVHSGGAKGADTAWAEAADKAGVSTQAHSFAGHESLGGASGFVGKRPALEVRNNLTTEQLKENTELVNAAGKVLGKQAGVTGTGGKLVHRNAYQVKDSDAVLAVVSGWTPIADGSRLTVGGRGTPWAVEMGILLKKPVFAFEQGAGKWFKFNPETKVWDELDGLPPKFKSFAGIGTASDLKPSGRKAIDDYIEQLSDKKVAAVIESKAETITSFRDKHRFLSNMSPSSITIEGIRYPTVEHAFQAAKTTDKELRKKIARAANPAEAKRMGRELDLRSDWNDIRVKAMEYILRKKFEDPKLLKQLLETGESKLIEGNTWGDKFWGQVDGEGKNVLGELLMKIRKELMKGK